MTDRFEIKITASNGATQVFQAVSRDADRMGTSVEQAAQKGDRSFKEWGKAAGALGGAIGAVGLVATKLAGDAEAAQARLETAFTNAGLAVDDYQARIDKLAKDGLSLAFDDEDVTDSLARLVGATGDYESAVQDLAIAQDLARSRQISLAEATNTVVATEAGRFRSLQQMGIVLDENATKEEALAALQQRVAGSAEAYAETGAATFERWQNAGENALESIGAHFVDLQGPILAASASVTAFGTVAGALKDVEIGSKLASVALGPAGLVAGVVAAGAAFYVLTSRTNEWEEAAESAGQVATNLKDAIGQLAATGNQEGADALGALLDDWTEVAKSGGEATKALNDVNIAIEDYNNQKSNTQPPLSDAQQLQISAQIDQLESLRDHIEDVALSSEQIDQVTADLQSLFSKPGIDAAKASADIEWYFDLYRQGAIDAATLVRYISESAEDWTRYSQAVTAATTAHGNLNTAFDKTASSMAEMQAQSVELMRAEEERSTALIASTVAGDHATVTVEQIAAAMEGGTQAAILNTEAIRKYAEAVGQMPAGETFGERLAQRAAGAGAALGDAFRTGVGNIGDLGGQSAQVAKWADELSNVEDGYSEINQLFDEGRLTAGEYNAALEAQNRIQTENAEIQRNVLDIQASQLPIIADLTAEQQRYLEHIAQQPAEVQAVALAYMDAETSAKGLELAQLAAAAAAGELGVAGTATAQNIIEGAVQADPYLKAMLEDMGLISVGADGTITVNFDSVEDAGASLDDLNTSLGTLIDILAEAFGIFVEDGQVVDSKEHVDELSRSMGDLDGMNALITVDGNATYADTYAGGVWNLKGALDALNGTTATTTIINRTINTIENQGGGLIPIPELHGGVVGGYADGGIVARMAEAGPELLRFRDGGMGVATTDGLYTVPRGTYVTPAPASKRALSGGPTFHIENLTVIANNPQEFAQQLYEFEMGGVRG